MYFSRIGCTDDKLVGKEDIVQLSVRSFESNDTVNVYSMVNQKYKQDNVCRVLASKP